MANIGYLRELLSSLNMKVRNVIATEFWDINRFPPGSIRNGVIAFNRIWFSLRLPASLSSGNAIVAEKVL